MIGLFRTLASSGPVTHIAPSGIFHFHNLVITNSMFYGWICIVVMLMLFIWVAHRMTIKPKKGFTQIVEVVAEFIINTVETAFEDKKRAKKYIPYFVTLFFFLLFCFFILCRLFNMVSVQEIHFFHYNMHEQVDEYKNKSVKENKTESK